MERRRFCGDERLRHAAGLRAGRVAETLNRWIADEAARAVGRGDGGARDLRFNDAATAIYRFVWNVYCDWYLELAKPVLLGPDGAAKNETRAMVAWVRDLIIATLHPFMPFITEELWAVTAEGGVAREQLLALSPWPVPGALEDADAESEIGWLVNLIAAIRSVRTEMNVAPALQIPLLLPAATVDTRERARRWSDAIKRMARISEITEAEAPPPGAVQLLVRGVSVALPLRGTVDIAAERARLDKEAAKTAAEIGRLDAKLANADFIARAPEEVVETEREKREDATARLEKIAGALARLQGVEMIAGAGNYSINNHL